MTEYSKDGKTDDERSQLFIDEAKDWTGFQILNSIPLADDQVELQVQVETQSKNGKINNINFIHIMKKIDGQWKTLREYDGTGFSD